MIEKDTYKTITSITEPVLFKDKNSKFFGYAFPVLNQEDVKNYLTYLKKEHHSARHWCYAYQLGTSTSSITYRVNDDGEPKNTAGMPIYGQIQSYGLTNTLIVVVRYFGGVKLGVSGLINAYKTASQMALAASKTTEKTIKTHYLIVFEYKNINTIMRIIKEKKITIINQKLETDCRITISVRKNEAETVFNLINRLFEIQIKEVQP